MYNIISTSEYTSSWEIAVGQNQVNMDSAKVKPQLVGQCSREIDADN